jgi:hypothetical protein
MKNTIAAKPAVKNAVKRSSKPMVKPAIPAIDADKKIQPPEKTRWAGRVPYIKQGKYEDGMPYDEVTYLAFKLILKPNRFVSRDSMFDFGKVVKKAALENGVGFSMKGFADEPIKIREVLFLDTPDFRLYNNAFILRRRIEYVDGFPASEPEIVFKFRHPDIQVAAETDVRPHIIGDHRVKFKCQALPLKDELGGIRLLFSHNVQFPRSHAEQKDVFSFETICEIFPALSKLKREPGEKIQLVNETIIEEVLQDIGMLDFGNGITAKCNVGIWRTRGEHRPLIGEFAYQVQFKNRSEMTLEEMKRAEEFFLNLQYVAKEWLALNATKTGVVYRMMGNAPKAHE